MIPKNYSEALSAHKASKERKSKRAAKAAAGVLGGDEQGYQWYSRPKKKAKKKKSPSRSKLEKEAWDAFSLYIRERDKDKGCISCGGPVEQAGHMISRRRRATKYDEQNVNGQCAACNWKDKFMPGYHDRCVSLFIDRYSLEIYTELVLKSINTVQHGKADMIALRDTYREKLLTLKASRAQQSEDDRMQNRS